MRIAHDIRISNEAFNRRTCIMSECGEPGTHYVIDKFSAVTKPHVLSVYCGPHARLFEADGYKLRLRRALDNVAVLA